MNCERVKELWDEYRDGSLVGADSRGLEQHLADCPACEKRWRRESAVLAILGEKTPIVDSKPGAFTAAVVRRWDRAGQPTVLARIGRMTAAAAAIALMLTAAAMMVDRGDRGGTKVADEGQGRVDSVGVLFASVSEPTYQVRQALSSARSWGGAGRYAVSLINAIAPDDSEDR